MRYRYSPKAETTRSPKFFKPRKALNTRKENIAIRSPSYQTGSSKPDAIWHVNTSFLRLLDGNRVYMHAAPDFEPFSANGVRPLISISLLACRGSEVKSSRTLTLWQYHFDHPIPRDKMTVLIRVSIAFVAANFMFGFAHCLLLNSDEPRPVFQLEEPPKVTASIVRSVRTLVESNHVLRPSFNDELLSRGFETFLLRIDPTKCFFFERDIDEFLPYKTQLDDQVRDDSIAFAYVVYKRYLVRLDEMLPIIHRQIDSHQDFRQRSTMSFCSRA